MPSLADSDSMNARKKLNIDPRCRQISSLVLQSCSHNPDSTGVLYHNFPAGRCYRLPALPYAALTTDAVGSFWQFDADAEQAPPKRTLFWGFCAAQLRLLFTPKITFHREIQRRRGFRSAPNILLNSRIPLQGVHFGDEIGESTSQDYEARIVQLNKCFVERGFEKWILLRFSRISEGVVGYQGDFVDGGEFLESDKTV
ncbi:uncharacterized protein BDR25DRAFT_357433 [Lindgomyces ingoldianus]|uniref:Uncharacterized protein n=1 Tax=Lindgomyces ingoldianus TaxID=673940 RepID=A0ACB6QQY0_9PLEO|nr:uncharacterized protein BDR25DRAFT_357433 [Lindgomyces ingoldianus]KAF2468500.1 hypothetical protein BDR25DRAFT_357433 [Lindgomyces ingoldianus]